MDTSERFTVAGIRRKTSDGHSLPSPSEVAWLLGEAERLERNNRALDREVARQDAELEQKDAEFTAAESELLDVSDELTRTRQDLELARLQLDAARQANQPQPYEHEAHEPAPLSS